MPSKLYELLDSFSFQTCAALREKMGTPNILNYTMLQKAVSEATHQQRHTLIQTPGPWNRIEAPIEPQPLRAVL